MAKKKPAVPDGILKAFAASPGRAHFGKWLDDLGKIERASFTQTCVLFLEKRANGETQITFDAFHALLIKHFALPFKKATLRSHLQRARPELFSKQKRSW